MTRKDSDPSMVRLQPLSVSVLASLTPPPSDAQRESGTGSEPVHAPEKSRLRVHPPDGTVAGILSLSK